jgi:hypothetical protein
VTGPQHYLQAEQLIRQGLDEMDPEMRVSLVAAAQAHAPLALAAATADNDPELGQSANARNEWLALINPGD